MVIHVRRPQCGQRIDLKHVPRSDGVDISKLRVSLIETRRIAAPLKAQ
jgi:hypothetical protein